MTVSIRPLTAADRAAWDPLWQGYLSFYKTELASEITDITWTRLLDAAEDMHCIVAETADGEMIGIVHYLYHRVTWAVADRCYLEDLFVAETARGTGAGRALIEAVYAAADARGADQVYWLTQDFNEEGRRLYDRVGRSTPFIKYQR
jgi:GNAT superfamily N-acetyltransferase